MTTTAETTTAEVFPPEYAPYFQIPLDPTLAIEQTERFTDALNDVIAIMGEGEQLLTADVLDILGIAGLVLRPSVDYEATRFYLHHLSNEEAA